MAIFEEKKTNPWVAVFLLLLFFALSCPLWHLQDREMFWVEGEYAVAALEMSSFPPVPMAHGHVLSDVQPLYLVLIKGLVFLGLPLEFALRFLSVLSYFALTWLVFWVCKRNCGLQAACASAAVMFTTTVVFERIGIGYPMALTAFLLYSGWMIWIELTLRRSDWQRAWIFAGLFAVLIYFNAGAMGLIYFIVPIIVQRRPLTVWQKINYPGFYIACLLVAAAILMRMLMAADLPEDPRSALPSQFNTSEYLLELLSFPVNTFFRLMPWSLLLWAPFCAALIPLLENPLFCKFHRIAFPALLLVIWFNPAATARDLFCLIPLLAVMTGSCYWIVVRRYGHRIMRIAVLCAWLLAGAGILAAVYLFLPTAMLENVFQRIGFVPEYSLIYKEEQQALMLAAGEVVMALLLAFLVLRMLRRDRQRPVWLIVAMLFSSTVLLFAAVKFPYGAQNRSKRGFAEQIRLALAEKKEQTPVYSNLYGLFAEGYYAGLTLRYADLDQLPEKEELVYIITTDAPSDPNRLWSKILDTKYRDTRFFIYKGQLIRSDEENDDV